MQMLLQHPYLVLWLNIPVLMGLALIGRGTHLDIQWHVTYLVIKAEHLAAAGCLLFACTGFIYWIGRAAAWNDLLTFAHLLLTVITLPAIVLLARVSTKERSRSLRKFGFYHRIFWMLLYLVVMSQGIFMVNAILTVFQKNG